MDNPYDAILRRLRIMLFNEKKHLKQLEAEYTDNGYIQFKKGKIYGIELMIENVLKDKRTYYGA